MLFQHGSASDAGTSTRKAAAPGSGAAAQRLPAQPAAIPDAARREAAGPGPGPARPEHSPADHAPDSCIGLIDSLLPAGSPSERRDLAALLADLLRTQLQVAWRALLDAHEPLWRQLPELATALDTEAALASLAAALEPASAFTLLAEHGALQRPGVLAAAMSHPAPASRETALDALLSALPPAALEGACRLVCIDQFVMALDRLPATDGAPVDWRYQIEEPSNGGDTAPPPRHEDASEVALLAALRSGDNRAAIGLLAAAALVPTESIDIAIGLRSRRAMVSLAWKAGFSMQTAVLLQSQLAEIACGSVLTAMEDGGCPLSRSEMAWQIGFLSRKLC